MPNIISILIIISIIITQFIIKGFVRDLTFGVTLLAFPHFLHISPRMLEKWEQGTAKPNEQASTLIALADKYPDTFERLEMIGA